MKILHFTESFLQPSETFIKRFVQKSCQFAQVAVASFNLHNIPADIDKGVILYKIDNPQFSRKNIVGFKRFIHEKITGDVIWHSQFTDVLNNFKPDIIHCHFGAVGVMMMQFNNSRNYFTPYVTSFYGYDISSLVATNKIYAKALKKLWRNGTGFFAEGPALKQKLIALGCPLNKCFINPILVPINDYPKKTNYRQGNETVKFLFAGRFVEKKGLQIFLEAIGKVEKTIGSFSIDIIGSGQMEPIYKQIIAIYQLEKFVKWHGMVNHYQIMSIMKDYDFLVHPSVTAKDKDCEGGAPTIIIEAQAAGLPVITSNHADIPFIMGYNDFMADENDVNSLIQVIIDAIACTNIQNYAQLGINKIMQQHNLTTDKNYENNLKKIIASQ